MLKKYSIWDKSSPVITPSGEIFTAEQWMDKYPVARLNNIIIVGSAGEINGGFFGTLGQMIQLYENAGLEIDHSWTPVEVLEAIEEFEAREPEKNDESTAEERIAAALEYANLINSPTINDDDPDEE